MKNLRILFMGTPEFAVTILKKILEEKYNVVGVVTAPDKPAGRGRQLKQSAVKEFALQENLEVLQPTNLKSDSFQEDLERLKPNVQVVVAFRMLPKIVWKFPEFGTFNLHASLLPQYRGAAPINWAIINGEKKTGVSTFFIDEKIDTGEMILQEEVEITDEDNAGSLHNKLMYKGADLVTKTLKLICMGNLMTIPQVDSQELKTAHKLDKENTKVDWEKDANQIYNFIRGLSPYPVAWSFFINDGKKMQCKIHKVSRQKIAHSAETGKVSVEDKKLKVAVKDGYIFIEEIQLPGKRKMDTASLLNGFVLAEDANML